MDCVAPGSHCASRSRPAQVRKAVQRAVMRVVAGSPAGSWRRSSAGPLMVQADWPRHDMRDAVLLSLSHRESWSVGRGGAGGSRPRWWGGSVLCSSRCAFCPREVQLKVPARVQSARFGARGGGAGRPGGRGDRRGRRPRRGPRHRVVQICCKGPDPVEVPEANRWYSALLLAADPGPGRLCNRFGHAPAPDCPRSPIRISQTARSPVRPRLLRPFLFLLLRPLTLHCRRRGAAGSEGAQQTRRGAADDLEGYSAGVWSYFREAIL